MPLRSLWQKLLKERKENTAQHMYEANVCCFVSSLLKGKTNFEMALKKGERHMGRDSESHKLHVSLIAIKYSKYVAGSTARTSKHINTHTHTHSVAPLQAHNGKNRPKIGKTRKQTLKIWSYCVCVPWTLKWWSVVVVVIVDQRESVHIETPCQRSKTHKHPHKCQCHHEYFHDAQIIFWLIAI